MIIASIPSPPESAQILLTLGPLQIRAYALSIILGIFVGLWLTTKRWVARGGEPEVVQDVALWGIPFGIVGGRIYHVISSPAAYFGEGGDPMKAFYIWEGGLGIWGAVALGVVGMYIGAKRHNVNFRMYLDALAPAVLLAQAIGRLGNWFNQELYGGPTTLPWGLEIDDKFLPHSGEYLSGTLFHPTFLYEMIWNVAGVFVILYLDRRLKLGFGRVFWLYVIVYVSGRLWIEMVRIDEAVHIGPLRINVWVSMLVLALGAFMFWWVGKKTAGLTEITHGPGFDGSPLGAATAAKSAKPAVAKAAPAAKKAATAKKAPAATTKAPAASVKTPPAKKASATKKSPATAKAPVSKTKVPATKASAAKKAPAAKKSPTK